MVICDLCGDKSDIDMPVRLILETSAPDLAGKADKPEALGHLCAACQVKLANELSNSLRDFLDQVEHSIGSLPI